MPQLKTSKRFNDLTIKLAEKVVKNIILQNSILLLSKKITAYHISFNKRPQRF